MQAPRRSSSIGTAAATGAHTDCLRAVDIHVDHPVTFWAPANANSAPTAPASTCANTTV